MARFELAYGRLLTIPVVDNRPEKKGNKKEKGKIDGQQSAGEEGKKEN